MQALGDDDFYQKYILKLIDTDLLGVVSTQEMMLKINNEMEAGLSDLKEKNLKFLEHTAKQIEGVAASQKSCRPFWLSTACLGQPLTARPDGCRPPTSI